MGPVNRSAQAGGAHPADATARRIEEVKPHGSDRVELSRQARLMDMLRNLPPVRDDVVQRVRNEIDAGTYETPQRIDLALTRMIEDLVE